jgi:prepilin-type N-terminal cleavage/methylation domain-containing protein
MKKKVTLKFRKKERGFTLIELLIVIAILGVLAAVVVPNVMGLFGRGGEQAYDSDLQTIQTSVATFFGDVHYGPDFNTGGDLGDETDYQNNTWGDTDGVAGHYFPTSTGIANGGAFNASASNHAILTEPTITHGDYDAELLFHDLNDDGNFDVGEEMRAALDGDEVVSSSAIWMGLLVNAEAVGAAAGQTDRGAAAAQTGEESMYLTEFPKSCSIDAGLMAGNGKPNSTGTYTWIVADAGKVLGCYRVANVDPDGAGALPSGDYWFAGFSGQYP